MMHWASLMHCPATWAHSHFKRLPMCTHANDSLLLVTFSKEAYNAEVQSWYVKGDAS